MVVNEGLLFCLEKMLLDPDFQLTAHLFKGVFPAIDENTALGDLTENDFPGYAPVGPVSFPTPAINVQGEAESDSPDIVFTRSSGAGSQFALGWYFTFRDDADIERLLFVEQFAVPVNVHLAGQRIVRQLFSFLKTY